jgi:phosphoglycerate dehydrogenase-like enzyme
MVVVVVAVKISDSLMEELKQVYPSVSFIFHPTIKAAKDVISDAHVLVTLSSVNEESIHSSPSLTWIHNCSAGIDKLPLMLLDQEKIQLTNSRGIQTIPMAEYTMGSILQFARSGFQFQENKKKKMWDRRVETDEIFGRTIGIIGTGSIGKKIAQLARAFGMRVCGVNTNGREIEHFDYTVDPTGLSDVLRDSDYIVLLTPHTRETEGLIGAPQLACMKSNAVLVNIARGAIVDEQALITALREKWIKGAILDVFCQEPLPENNPLWELDNVILTPHIAAKSPLYMERTMGIFKHNSALFLEGKREEMENVVDIKRGY